MLHEKTNSAPRFDLAQGTFSDSSGRPRTIVLDQSTIHLFRAAIFSE